VVTWSNQKNPHQPLFQFLGLDVCLPAKTGLLVVDDEANGHLRSRFLISSWQTAIRFKAQQLPHDPVYGSVQRNEASSIHEHFGRDIVVTAL
jgi:hypothetical protein